MFAIVDIETTGGYAGSSQIIEVAVVLHDGHQKVREFSTLVNPGVPIPRMITRLTGIDNAMVAKAPSFADIAEQLQQLLSYETFVAHSVDFDLSFIKQEFARVGIKYRPPHKLCTVRLGRAILPGLRSYSLANLCQYLGVENQRPHRALSDARATEQIFERYLKHDSQGIIPKKQTYLLKNQLSLFA